MVCWRFVCLCALNVWMKVYTLFLEKSTAIRWRECKRGKKPSNPNSKDINLSISLPIYRENGILITPLYPMLVRKLYLRNSSVLHAPNLLILLPPITLCFWKTHPNIRLSITIKYVFSYINWFIICSSLSLFQANILEFNISIFFYSIFTGSCSPPNQVVLEWDQTTKPSIYHSQLFETVHHYWNTKVGWLPWNRRERIQVNTYIFLYITIYLYLYIYLSGDRYSWLMLSNTYILYWLVLFNLQNPIALL